VSAETAPLQGGGPGRLVSRLCRRRAFRV